MANRIPNNVFFQTDMYLPQAGQVNARLGLCEFAQKKGFDRFGAEFLFMSAKDMNHLPKQIQAARGIQKKMDRLFGQTYFSIHAPWMPVEQTRLHAKSKQTKNLKRLLSFCPDFVDVVNLHVGSIGNFQWKKNFAGNFEKKMGMMEQARNELADLSDAGPRLCVETIYSPDHVGNQVNCASNLPDDMMFLSKPQNVGITIDTAHVGLAIESCRYMVSNEKLLTGFFEEEWKSIRTVAKKEFNAFEGFKSKLWHIHLNGYQTKKNAHSESGKDGLALGRGNKTAAQLLGQMERLAKNTNKKKLGVTLEIQETDYLKLFNSAKTIQAIGGYYGIEN